MEFAEKPAANDSLNLTVMTIASSKTIKGSMVRNTTKFLAAISPTDLKNLLTPAKIRWPGVILRSN